MRHGVFCEKVATSAPEDRERITVLECSNAAGKYVLRFFLQPSRFQRCIRQNIC